MARTKKKPTLFNPGTTPVVFDGEGRIVAGGQRVEVDKVGPEAQEAIERELLVLESEESAPEVSKPVESGESAPDKAS